MGGDFVYSSNFGALQLRRLKNKDPAGLRIARNPFQPILSQNG